MNVSGTNYDRTSCRSVRTLRGSESKKRTVLAIQTVPEPAEPRWQPRHPWNAPSSGASLKYVKASNLPLKRNNDRGCGG
jgi:hypothetical protein